MANLDTGRSGATLADAAPARASSEIVESFILSINHCNNSSLIVRRVLSLATSKRVGLESFPKFLLGIPTSLAR